MNRYENLHRIQGLDPERDYHEIYRTMVLVEFRWDMLMGLQLAFYRTYVVPSISRLLDQAGELTQRPRKRAIDTALLMLELVDHGFSHPRGRDVVRRLNRIHQQYEITNADYLYVLGTLVFVPTRWLERYGWRPLCCHERTATYAFYRELGRRMGIKDIPASYEAFETFFDAFEREHFRPTPASRRLMHASRELLVGRFPHLLGRFAEGHADALLDDRLREAVGVDPPPRPIRVALHITLKTRARLLRLMPPRREPVETEGVKYGIKTASIYPRGYRVSDLGPAEPPDEASIDRCTRRPIDLSAVSSWSSIEMSSSPAVSSQVRALRQLQACMRKVHGSAARRLGSSNVSPGSWPGGGYWAVGAP